MVIIGIDLGTTNSCVAVKKGKEEQVKVIPNSSGANTTPSFVSFDENGSFVVGEAAKRQMVMGRTVYDSKRLIGKKNDDAELKKAKSLLAYSIVASANGDAVISLDGKLYNPIDIASKILIYLKECAEEFLGTKVSGAVITVPAYFNDSQRQATKIAGEIAGLKVERIINEPTAAALAYGFDKEMTQKIVVYDLGGGTFDVSVLSIENGVFEVLATNGDTFLGGSNFDEAVMKYLIEECERIHSVKVDLTNKQLVARFKEEAEKAKINLSSSLEYDVMLPFLQIGTKAINFQLKLTRAKLNSLTTSLVESSLIPCQKALKDAGLSISDINAVILVGGMTRMPFVQEKVEKFFGKKPHKGVNPDEVVAVGAAIQGAVLQGDVKGVLLLDVTPLSLGIETAGGVLTVLIPRNTTIPTKKSQIFSTAEDNQREVSILVYQGERGMARDNHFLGSFNLDGIPPAKRGVPQIEVTFELDANGLLTVHAKDLGTQKSQQIQIQPSGGLTKEQIEKMKKEAEENAEKDKERVRLVQLRNEADQNITATEEHMEKYQADLAEADKDQILKSVENLKSVKDSEDADAIQSAIDELKKNSRALGEIVYKKSKEASQNGSQEEEKN